MTIVEHKEILRKKMLFQRSRLDKQVKEKYDAWICKKVWEIICEKNFETIHCYLPMGTEINISPLIEKLLNENITVVTPKTFPKRKLQNLILKSLNQVEKGVFGTTHPANTKEYIGQYDLILTPGLAFDTANYRLGYGGGYYDNFMVQFPSAYKLGIFYPFQKMETLPIEPHDVQLDDILFNDAI